jgi:glyoxylase-like metal-dependent hydrolase (beta-lactamase superfamily II)
MRRFYERARAPAAAFLAQQEMPLTLRRDRPRASRIRRSGITTFVGGAMGRVARVLAVLALGPGSVAGAGESTVFDLEIRALAPDIYVLQRPDVLRQPVEPNALVIVNERDVVVDPGGVPRSAENAIKLIRSVTDKPVAVLVNTHWHGDHVLGNQVYRQEFPDVRIVAHANTHRDITGKPLEYIGRQDKMFVDLVADWEAKAAAGTLEPKRVAILPDLKLAMAENRRVRVTPPTETFTDTLVLQHGRREIQVRYLGRDNTEGDAIVWLPRERVLASGDLVVAPIPYGFGSFPKEWIATLDRIAAYDFKLLVPGHGDVMTGRDHIRLVQDMLREVRKQVAACVKQGLDLEATRKAVDLSVFEKRIAGDDKQKQLLFNAWWKQPIVRSAWLEARGEPIVQGAADETG